MALKQPKDDASYAEWDAWHNDLHYRAIVLPFFHQPTIIKRNKELPTITNS